MVKGTLTFVFSLLVALMLAGCGKELGRIPFTGEGAGEAQVTLTAGEVRFWTDIDIEYEGAAAVGYQVELLQGGAVVANAACDPLGNLDIKTSSVQTNFGNSHTLSVNGRMSCTATVANGGPTTVKAAFAFAQKPANLVLRKADLVIKQ